MALEDLFGTWKLISHQFAMTDTDERRDMFGADPRGTLVITSDQRMMALITSNDRQPSDSQVGDAALFKSMLAYSGPVRIEGDDQFITTVEVSWQPGWVGSEQARTFSLNGDILSIMTPEMLHPMFPGWPARGVLKFQRISTF